MLAFWQILVNIIKNHSHKLSSQYLDVAVKILMYVFFYIFIKRKRSEKHVRGEVLVHWCAREGSSAGETQKVSLQVPSWSFDFQTFIRSANLILRANLCLGARVV